MKFIRLFPISVILALIFFGFFIPSDLGFIGYSEKGAMFYSYSERKVYTLINDSLTLFRKLPQGAIALSASNEYLLTASGKGKSKIYILYSTTDSIVYNNLNASNDLIVDKNGCVFYTDKSDNVIKSPNYSIKDKILCTTLLYSDGDFIYYCLDNEESTGPDAIVYQYNLKSRTRTAYGKHLMDEGQVFFKDRNMFLTERLIKGKFRPVILNMETKDYIEFDDQSATRLQQASTKFYHPGIKALCIIVDGKIEVIKNIF